MYTGVQLTDEQYQLLRDVADLAEDLFHEVGSKDPLYNALTRIKSSANSVCNTARSQGRVGIPYLTKNSGLTKI